MIRVALIAASALALTAPATAESVKGKQLAANGVELETYIDDFAGKAEYDGPTIKFKLPEQYLDSIAFVSRTKKGGTWGPTQLVVMMYYRGDWRFYNSAVFKGGEQAQVIEAGRDVLSCSGSRYGGCSHSEALYVTVTPEQLAKYAENGQLQVQVGGKAASGTVVTVPVAHFEALNAIK
jgi:hypothetical protein